MSYSAGLQMKGKIFSILFLLLFSVTLAAQVQDPLYLVNPFIGTAKSSSITKWGSEGGTYPGAVAPSGYIQLSPETTAGAIKGYNYADSTIMYFSCLHHSSGFPNGSAGRLLIMPVGDSAHSGARPFHHTIEKAEPGYYKVTFSDDGTIAEATASQRAGIFRCTFPKGVLPKIMITDAGELSFENNKIIHGTSFNTVISCSEPITTKAFLNHGSIISFAPSVTGATIIELAISASPAGLASAQKNIDIATKDGGFDAMKKHTQTLWRQTLSVIAVDDSNLENKQKFYTAMYHASLIPWIISDEDGNYMGEDGKLHKTKGVYEYGNFSPWDTYRSLHPMLSLLFPQKQKDVLLSMMDIYDQSGYLPTESMTGNHSISIITDAWLKGIRIADSQSVYTAMKKSIMTGPYIQADMKVYNDSGYIPFTYPESVTRTVEYSYDDWVLAQFAKQVMNQTKEYNYLLQKGNNYKNIFNEDSLLMLPRYKNDFKLQPGNTGYKEGDKWVYSYAIQHNIQNVINLMGGSEEFCNRLDAFLDNGEIVFDNETAFHIPYLFNIAGHPELTQKWIGRIMDKRFANSPGGLPGNDDLGATSSWFVWSAIGLYPLSPGTPYYTIGSPLFKTVSIHLANKKTFVIKSLNAGAANMYVGSLSVNNKPWKHLYLPHSLIMNGGEMLFGMQPSPEKKWFDKKPDSIFSMPEQLPNLTINDYVVSKKKVLPNEKFWFKFSIKNNGSTGTKVVKLYVDGKENNYKNCMVSAHAFITDSVSCTLFAEGAASVNIDNKIATVITVEKPPYPYSVVPAIQDFFVQSMVKYGDSLHSGFIAQNTGGVSSVFYVPVFLDDQLIMTDTIKLSPGEKRFISQNILVKEQGIHVIKINDLITKI